MGRSSGAASEPARPGRCEDRAAKKKREQELLGCQLTEEVVVAATRLRCTASPAMEKKAWWFRE
jgi:hypothetical protein